MWDVALTVHGTCLGEWGAFRDDHYEGLCLARGLLPATRLLNRFFRKAAGGPNLELEGSPLQ